MNDTWVDVNKLTSFHYFLLSDQGKIIFEECAQRCQHKVKLKNVCSVFLKYRY